MECGQCGAHAADDQRFCGQCGAVLVAVCASCSTENPPGHKFCGACGTAIEAAGSPDSAPAATERRVVSVLFVDIVGFTSYSEGRDPEDVRDLITRYFDVAKDVLDRFGGTVDKFIGDAVMAWWGATTSNEDDAERAVRSALEIIDGVADLGDQVGIPELKARAGVMTGEASVGPGGNEKGLLLGDLVNSASRLQSLAGPGTVFVGDVTRSLVSTAIELEDAGTHQVKGKEEKLHAWHAVRVLSERGGRGRADVLEPPFTGRTSELRLLKDSLHATGSERRSRLVSLIGQAGIGKSRLMWEFLKYIDGLVDDIYWHEGRSPSYGDGVALWALGEMIRQRAGIQENDTEEVTAARLTDAVAEFVDPDRAEWVRERLASILGLSLAVGDRSELYAAARAFFESISQRGTTVLVFEDLHWADPGMLEFIEGLPDWSQNHPILVITLTRPDLLDRRPDWGSGRRGFTSMYLPPLTDDEMRQLITGTIAEIPDDATGRIVDAAAGIPLFAVEMMRMLLGEGSVTLDDEGRAVAGDIGALEVPTSVQAIIAARLDRLPSEERDLARDASVLGFSFAIEGLAALREETIDKLGRRLSDLVRHEILELIADPRSPERGQYQWVQSVLREVAYGRISRVDKRDLHLRVARYMGGIGEPELAPVAASHYLSAAEQGEDDADIRDEMVEVLNAALDRAIAIHAYEQVISLVDAAVPFVDRDRRADLHEIGSNAGTRLNDLETADRHVEALKELAEGDESMTHRAMAVMGTVATETQRSYAVVDELVEYAERYPDLTADPNLARVASNLSRALTLDGRLEAGADWADAAIGAAEQHGLLNDVANAMITRGTALSATRNRQGMALLYGGLNLAREIGSNTTALRAMINIGYASFDPVETRQIQEDGYALARQVGDRNAVLFLAGNLMSLLLYELDLAAADHILDELGATGNEYLALEGSRVDLMVLRDEMEAAAELHERLREPSMAGDTQTMGAYERSVAQRALLSGDPATTFEIGIRHLRSANYAPALSLSMAWVAALRIGDPDKINEVAAVAATFPAGGYNDVLISSAAAGAAVVRGDIEEGIRITEDIPGNMARASAISMVYHYAGLARLLPADHEARPRYFSMARRIAAEAAAAALVRFVDEAEVG